MKPPQRVVWSEGMLVSPQHLQQQDLYHERLLDERIAALAPYRWGVVTAEIDVGALGTDQLRVTKFVGILPDGLYLGFEGGDPECPPARPVGANFPPTQASCDVYLGVPKEREGVPSVSAELSGGPPSTRAARARFRAVSRSIADLTGNAADLSMAFAHRNTVVLFGSESREDFETVKIAEIVRDGRGALIVNETYIPPTPRIDTSQFLMGRVRHILSLLVVKQRQLAGDRRQRDGASIEFAAGDVTRFLQLSTVNTAIPLLTYAAANGEITPNQLYLLLVQVAGQLATFGSDIDPSKLPLFQYTDLRATFEELFARVTNLLRTTVREAYMTVPMEVVDGIHLGKLDDDRLIAATQYVLAVRSEIPEAQLGQRLPGLCKISSRTQLPQVIRAAATPGVPIQITHRPPSEIPVKAGVTYFNLTTQNEFWKAIVDERLVAIYLPPPFGPQHVKLELLAVAKGWGQGKAAAMDTLNQITAECFNALSQLRELDGPVNSPEMVHDRLRGYVDAMRERAREQGMPQRDADDIAYAIVALCDEIAMGKPEPLRGYWMSHTLALHFFNDALAGEGFFSRMTDVRRDQRRVDVLRVYYQCLLFGFQGKFGMRGGEIELIKIADSLRPEIERNIDVPDRLSPAGEPPDEPMVRSGGRNPILWIALGVFAVAIAVFISLKISLDREVSGLVDRVDQLNR